MPSLVVLPTSWVTLHWDSAHLRVAAFVHPALLHSLYKLRWENLGGAAVSIMIHSTPQNYVAQQRAPATLS